MKVRGNYVYCERHKGWFFSSKYARDGSKPLQCNICKRNDWEEVKK